MPTTFKVPIRKPISIPREIARINKEETRNVEGEIIRVKYAVEINPEDPSEGLTAMKLMDHVMNTVNKVDKKEVGIWKY